MEEKQIIVSISREYGSGGRKVAIDLAQRLGFPIYEKNIILEIAKAKGVDMSEWLDVEEKPKRGFLYKKVGNLSSDPHDLIHEMEFDFIKEKAASGESFVVMGRCSDWILREYPGLIKIFIRGDVEDKVVRLMHRLNESEEAARADIVKIDNLRRKYHNKNSGTKWGDSRYYDMCINTRIGLDVATDVIEKYVREHIKFIDSQEN